MMESDLSSEDQLAEQAAIWCARVFGRSSEPFDDEAFQNWIEQSDAHRQAFDAMAETWCLLEDLPPEVVSTRDRPAREAEVDGAQGGARYTRRYMLAAAAAAVTVLAVSGYVYYDHLPHAYATEIGRRSLVRLDDGSRITLDGATRVRFAEDDASRTAWLDAGRASFDVAHDPSRPFSVHAGDKVVVAVGTSFTVERLQDQVRANLHSGAVDVIDNRSGGGGKRYRLNTAGDRFVSRNDGRGAVITHNAAANDLAWTKGILNFNNESLAVTVERMNRYSDLQIVLAPGLEDDRVSGIFRAGETEKFVAAASELLNLRTERAGNTIRLSAATP